MNPITIITISCLIASVSCANFPRSPRNLQPSQSQLTPQALPAPGAPSDVAAKAAAQQAKLHYVEIDPSLKGNYKFGYDTGSGPAGQSFREETRLDDGTVKGAYGYVDANGKQRIVKYTAGKAGFVVEGDQEAPGQGGQAAQPAEPAAQPVEVRRPQPVNLPQQAAQPQFDDQQPQLNRNAAVVAPAEPTAEDRARAEQLHAEGLRQHQLATQAALAQQQKLAQQLQQLQQQQIAAAQRQAPQQAPQQQPRQQLFQQQQQQQPQQQQPQFGAAPQPQQPAAQAQFAPHPHHHQHQHAAHIVDPQSGSFFSSSNDANLNQLLQNQLRQLQSGHQFAGQQFPQPPQQQQQQQQPQQFAPQAGPQFAPQQPPTDFNQLRAARQVAQQQPAQQQQQFSHHHQSLSPANALATLHQQHQQDAQMLAALRAQQLARLQEQSRQAPRPQQQQQFEQPQPQQFQAEPQQQSFAPQPQQPIGQRISGPQASFAPQPQSSAAAPTVVAQPENFGPPVIDIRTLNYSIGQQTRV